MCGPVPKLPKLLVVAALAVAALATTPLASASPPGPGVADSPSIIAIL